MRRSVFAHVDVTELIVDGYLNIEGETRIILCKYGRRTFLFACELFYTGPGLEIPGSRAFVPY